MSDADRERASVRWTALAARARRACGALVARTALAVGLAVGLGLWVTLDMAAFAPGVRVAAADEALPPFLEGPAREAFLVETGERLRASRTVFADFVQLKAIPLFQHPARSDGTILFAAPDRLRWEIRAPFESLLVVSGESVAKFEVRDGVRRELKLGGSRDALSLVMGRIQAWFRGEFDDDGHGFRVQVRAAPVPVIVMTPSSAALAERLGSITLELAPDLASLARLILRERDGGTTTMAFTLRGANLAFPERTFSTTDPLPLAEVRAGATEERR